MIPQRDVQVLRQLRTRHGRGKSPFFVCEGVRAGGEALRLQPGWLAWAVLTEDFNEPAVTAALLATGKPVYRLPAAAFAELAFTESPQGLLLVLHRPDLGEAPPPPPADPFVLVLDRIGDPGNFGAILRTAWAAGLRSIATTTGATDAYGPKAVRAGMGAQFALAVHRFADLAALRTHYAAHGYTRLWLTTPHGGVSCFAPEFALRQGLLVFGNEAAGVADAPGAEYVQIPMPGPAESLNVAQAATILLFDAVRRGLLQ